MMGAFDEMQQAMATLQQDVAQLKNRTGNRVVVTQHLDADFQTYTSGLSANAVDSIPHKLGRPPQGVIVVGQSGPGNAYATPDKAHTSSTAFMASTTAGTTYKLLLY